MGFLKRIFGPSFNELAQKELQLRREYSMKHGEPVNVNIDDLKLGDEIIRQNNKKNISMQKTSRYSVYFLLSLFVLVIVYITVYNIVKPKPDFEGYNKVIDSYLSQIGNVSSFNKSSYGDDIYYVTVNSNTWIGTELDKVSYCDSIRKTFTAYAWDYHIIDNDNTIYVIFRNEEGITLAEPDGIGFGKYKIYY